MQGADSLTVPSSAWLYAGAMLLGGAIMSLEIIGSRTLAPMFGTGLVPWASLLATALAALSIGYYIGGRNTASTPVSLLLAHASTSISALFLLRGYVLDWASQKGLLWGALSASILLFSAPLGLMAWGEVTLLKQSGGDGVLSRAGTVLGASTVGGVLGTMFVAFVSIPHLGTQWTGVSLAFILLLVSLVLHLAWPASSRAFRYSRGATITVLVLAATLFKIHTRKHDYGFRIVADFESAAEHVRVVDTRWPPARWMIVDWSVVSAASRVSGAPLFSYLGEIGGTRFPVNINRALVIGLGGGYIPRMLEARHIPVDVVELDGNVVKAATDYFGFKSTGAVMVGDARRIVRSLPTKYDLVVHDCFSNGIVSPHLLTVEAMEEVKAVLTDRGVLILNYYGYSRGTAMATVLATLEQVFRHVEHFVSASGEEPIDNVIVASDVPWQAVGRASRPVNGIPVAPLKVWARPATDDLSTLELEQLREVRAYSGRTREILPRGVFLGM